MSSQSHTADVIVLRKTKLGEGDLILTCLDSSGAQVRFVAKGARKPSSTFSSRLELFAQAHVLIIETKGGRLDICREAKLVEGNARVRGDLERSAGASALCELLAKTTEEGLGNAKLFPFVQRALASLRDCRPEQVVCVTAAALLKTFAFQGFRPELRQCVGCGEAVARAGREEANRACEGGECGGSRDGDRTRGERGGGLDGGELDGGGLDGGGLDGGELDGGELDGGVLDGGGLDGGERALKGQSTPGSAGQVARLISRAAVFRGGGNRSWTAFSLQEGGVLCASCRTHAEYVRIDDSVLTCARTLMFATFDELEAAGVWSPRVTTGVLHLCQQWARVQLGVTVKSIDFLLSAALV